ncbi:S-protein homologue 1 [Hibiscus trionum]|uniref:S-protein homolog n=1 Tax=Hibiscus trionum TaxID=183268 RepID=A0A9W7HDU7_HIBTR|nr:S-protein homologue 1 [Hibiscus trionum]
MYPAQNVTKVLLVLMLCMARSLVTARSLAAYLSINEFCVHVVNGFSNLNETLNAHCRSKGVDFGLRYIPVQGEFNWSFHIKYFLDKTKFSCHMWWSGGEKYLDVFWVDDRFLSLYCAGNNCYWMSRDDGIYLFDYRYKEYIFQYNWDAWHGEHLEKKMS